VPHGEVTAQTTVTGCYQVTDSRYSEKSFCIATERAAKVDHFNHAATDQKSLCIFTVTHSTQSTRCNGNHVFKHTCQLYADQVVVAIHLKMVVPQQPFT
jgi:hypothetical protein